MKKGFKIIGGLVVGLLLLIGISMVLMDISPIPLGMHESIIAKDGVAIDGYDVVSYFHGKPVNGYSEFSADYKDITWYFSDATNRETFLADPDFYLPQFGGYCSKAVSAGFVAPSEPDLWIVEDNKLYLFSNLEVMEEFKEDPAKMINACNHEWTSN